PDGADVVLPDGAYGRGPQAIAGQSESDELPDALRLAQGRKGPGRARRGRRRTASVRGARWGRPGRAGAWPTRGRCERDGRQSGAKTRTGTRAMVAAGHAEHGRKRGMGAGGGCLGGSVTERRPAVAAPARGGVLAAVLVGFVRAV